MCCRCVWRAARSSAWLAQAMYAGWANETCRRCSRLARGAVLAVPLRCMMPETEGGFSAHHSTYRRPVQLSSPSPPLELGQHSSSVPACPSGCSRRPPAALLLLPSVLPVR
ncbi:uncharacterized protein BDZ99DRAFT_54959 [Mytilinidion resinicola]|uniref:Secreted protein n=1 Tax=Mytilinidion resinicola TaxID=574789 RepID=A0A6A6YIL1_9PEZI|nr:uncharacterized protein BDZ99DRAFT_54959 [Mytilinidion resinicola]KAF2808399.1 hypothetical protein BDZ99DRAFT_54959 [Mytilinidion resinicola]